MKQKLNIARKRFVKIARCPTCRKGKLQWTDEVAICKTCHAWFPIIDDIPELVPISIAYNEDREKTWKHVGIRYRLHNDSKQIPRYVAQDVQRHHFDTYATDSTQSYNTYERMSFWKAIDKVIFGTWMDIMPDQATILDVGCAQGRSTAPFINKTNTVIGFDISKKMIETGNNRFKKSNYPPYYFVGDATCIPIDTNSVDIIVLYGVLHHMTPLKTAIKEIVRILKPGGLILSLENNRTPLRFLFDILQKLWCLWNEKAGESPTMSSSDITRWFSETNLTITTHTHVFIPPHIINALPTSLGYKLTVWTDFIASKIPFVRSWGGLIEIIGRKNNRSES
jgi:ubiquinone/menaquinone biosynthesis C-methylase UbiE/uncharacterized protein YbaR (Trm112 family)